VQEKARGCKSCTQQTESPIVADIELTLAWFLISQASYHGGDFNEMLMTLYWH
jgi:hypothetical protein